MPQFTHLRDEDSRPPPSRCLPPAMLARDKARVALAEKGGADWQYSSRFEVPGVLILWAPAASRYHPSGTGPGPGGYSRVRSYFHTPFASPSARRSPPPPRPLLPAPGRLPFFTTSQRPPPAVLDAMAPTLPPLPPPWAFRSRAGAPRSATSLRRASRRVTPPARQPGTRSLSFFAQLFLENVRVWGSGLLRSKKHPGKDVEVGGCTFSRLLVSTYCVKATALGDLMEI